MSSYAVIQTGGKQYRVQPGDVIDVEKLEQEVGARIDLADVLLVGGDDAVSVGTPTVDGAKVTAEVADQFRGPKIIVYKYKAKTHYRRKNGHRQSYTRLRIRHILTDGAEEPEEVVEAVVEEAVEEAPAPRRRRRSTRATAAAAAEEPAAEEAAADEAAAEEPVAAAEEAEAAEVVEAEASVEAEEAPAEEASEEAPAEETAEEAASEEAGEEEKKAE